MKASRWSFALILLLSACSAPAGTTESATISTRSEAAASAEAVTEPAVATAPAMTRSVSMETPIPSATAPMSFILPTPGVEPVSAWRPPLYPSPWAPTLYDHFYFARPIAADEVNWPLPNYRYGGILEEQSAHTGIDISAPWGTEVLAAGPGTVTWAGWGFSTSDPGNRDDPYGKAIIIRHDFGYQDQPLFTIYAHLSETEVVAGQWVDTGDLIGYVGETGMTTGPHLHFEVRVGVGSFFSTRNPELWLVPPQGWGVLALRVMDTARVPLSSKSVLLTAEETGISLVGRTYGAGAIIPDPYYRENLVLSDLPAGVYRVQILFGGFNYDAEVQVLPGQVTFISFQGYYGFDPTLPATPSNPYFVTPNP